MALVRNRHFKTATAIAYIRNPEDAQGVTVVKYLLEDLMIDRNAELQELGFFGRLARTEKAIRVAALVAILASVGVFFAIGGYDAVAGPIVCLIAVIAGLPHYCRHAERMRRGKEILNRYGPERNPRPLGL